MIYSRPTSHLPHNLQCDSNIWTACRRAATCGPIPFTGRSSRKLRMIAPTPCFPQAFGPIALGMTCAEASKITIETSVSKHSPRGIIACNLARSGFVYARNGSRVVKRAFHEHANFASNCQARSA